MYGTSPLSCGGCLPCRIKQKRLWTYRQVLESYIHEENSFVTLTYSDEHLPKDGSVDPIHLKNFLKRFRKAISPRVVRFYAVAEYGEKSLRPHYHLSMFGTGQLDGDCIQKKWGMGHSLTAEFTPATAAYTCGYVVTKWKHKIKPDPVLGSLHKEFQRQSNRPGIGADAMAIIANSIDTIGGLNELQRVGDVPHSIKTGGKKISLGRYLVDKLRDEIGMSDEQKKAIKQSYLTETGLEMLALYELHIKNGKAVSLRDAVTRENHQAVLNMEGREKIHSARKTL